MTQNIVVFGGTGQQGSAFIRALGDYNSPVMRFTIYLLARNPDAGNVTRLREVPGVTVVPVANDYTKSPDLALKATGLEKGDVHGVFCVNGYMSEEEEEQRGIAVAEAAAEWKVKHFVYCSVCHDDTVDTKEDGFDANRVIERAIKRTSMDWTMLRDTDFMDNWLPSQRYSLKVYRTMLLRRTFYNHPERKISMVSTRDIGRAGALAFAEPEKYRNAKMNLAGDLLNTKEIQKIYSEVMGEPIVETWGFLATLAKWMDKSVAQLAKHYDDEGYGIGPEDTRKFMEVENFRSFLERYKREHAAH